MADLTPAAEAELVALVKSDAEKLCTSLTAASAAGVGDALILPTLLSVFREAGMLPESLDIGSIMGLFR